MVEGGGEPQSGRQRLHNTENSQMASTGAIFSSMCVSHKAAKSMALVSCVLNYSWLSACPG